MGIVSDVLKKGLSMIPKSGAAAADPKPVEKTAPGKAVTDNSGSLGKAATEAIKRKKATEEAMKATE